MMSLMQALSASLIVGLAVTLQGCGSNQNPKPTKPPKQSFEQNLSGWFSKNPKGFQLDLSTAAALAKQEAPKLTTCGITLPDLGSLCKYYKITNVAAPKASAPSADKLKAMKDVLSLAYQQITPVTHGAMQIALLGTGMQKDVAWSNATQLVTKGVSAKNLGDLFQQLSSTSGVGLDVKDARSTAVDLALAGADSAELVKQYKAASAKGIPQDEALKAAIPLAVIAGYQGMARRHALDTKLYTAKEFSDYYGSQWLQKWSQAPQEQRVANDYKAYTIAEYMDHYKDTWTSMWQKAQSATQERLFGGSKYDMTQFSKDSSDGWYATWFSSPILPCAECHSSVQTAETIIV